MANQNNRSTIRWDQLFQKPAHRRRHTMSLGARAGKSLAWLGVEPLESRMLMTASLSSKDSNQGLFSDYILPAGVDPESVINACAPPPSNSTTPAGGGNGCECGCGGPSGMHMLPVISAPADAPSAADTAATSATLASATSFSSTGIPLYHSNPDASATIYLDFDGDSTASWGSYSNIVTPVFSIDSDANYSATELSRITDIWTRVAEDYAPFNIDVTTESPGSFNNKQALRIAIGGDGAWLGSAAGGVAYTYTFTNSIVNTVFVFPQMLGNGTAKYVADASSHEAGHAFGLDHQSSWNGSTKTAEYNPGSGGWAPLMGNSYSQPLSTWSNGFNSSHSTQDDMAVIASTLNGFGFRADDHGDTNNTGDDLTIASNGTAVSGSGIIGTSGDVDVFDVYAGTGSLSITVTAASLGNNLDTVLSLFDSAGNLITTASPSNSYNATITTTVTEGTYHLRVAGPGTYGYVGQYSLSGTITAPTNTPPPPQVVGPLADVQLSGADIASGSAVSFGTVNQNAAAPTKTFTVTNSGDQTLTLGALQLPTGFSVTNTLVNSLAPGTSDTFTIQMSTVTAATRNGTLSFTTNDPTHSTESFTLSGTVQAVFVGPIVGVTLDSANISDGDDIDFGTVPQNSTPPLRTFTVTNSGDQTLGLGALQLPPGFTLTNTLASTLAPGSSDTFTLQMPTSGVVSNAGVLTFTTTDASQPIMGFNLFGDVVSSADEYESNDSKDNVDNMIPGGANSASLGEIADPLTINHLNTTDNTEDWFSFTMNGFGASDEHVRIIFDSLAGDLDLFLYRADGTTLAGQSIAASSNSETVTLAGMAPGTYYVRVVGFQGALNPDYSLTIVPANDPLVVDSTGRQTFLDSNGTSVIVKLRGEGEVTFTSNALTGDFDVLVTGSDINSSLTIRTLGRDTHTALGNVTITGSLGTFSARTTDLHGNFSATGAVHRLALADINGGTQQNITIGSSPDSPNPIAITLNDVADLNISSQTVIGLLTVQSWTDLIDTADLIDAPRLNALRCGGDFNASLTLTGDSLSPTLRRASIAGAIGGGQWNITGDIGSITAASTDAAWQLAATGHVQSITTSLTMAGDISAGTFRMLQTRGDFSASITAGASNELGESIHGLRAVSVLGSNITATGKIGLIRVESWQGGSITAAAIGSITTLGDFSSQVDATDAVAERSIARFTVGRTLATSTIRAASAIGAVRVGAMVDTHLYAGVSSNVTDLPASVDDFDAMTTIDSLRVRGLPDDPNPAFRNSFIAAFNMRVARLGHVQTQNNGTPFGLATHTFSRIEYRDTPAAADRHALSPASTTTPDNDFIIRVV